MAAFIAGFGGGLADAYVQHKTQQREDKKQLSDEEREQKLSDHNNSIRQLQTRMSAVSPTNPDGTTNPAYADLNSQLSQVVADRTALFHPDNGPGALAHLGKMVWDKVHGPQTPAPTTDTSQPVAVPGVSVPQSGGTFTPQGIPTAPAIPASVAAPGPGWNPANGPSIPSTVAAPPSRPVTNPVSTPAPAQAMSDASVALPAAGAGPQIVRPKIPAVPADIRKQVQDLASGAPQDPLVPAGRKADFDRTQKGITNDWQIAWAQKHGVSDAAVDELTEHLAGVPAQKGLKSLAGQKPYQGADGKYYIVMQDPSDGSIKAEVLPPDYVPPSAGGPKVGSLGEFLTAAYGAKPTPAQEIAGRKLWQQAGASTTVGEHVVMVPQPDGSIRAVTVQTTSSKNYGAGAGAPNVRADGQPAPTAAAAPVTPPGSTSPSSAAPKPTASTAPTAGALRKQAGALASTANRGKSKAGVVNTGDVVGGRVTPSQSKADDVVNKAAQLVSVADDASKNPTAAKDKNLALAIIRGAAGRVNMQEYNILTQKAGLGNSLEAWANSATTGQLPTDVRNQLVQVAHSNFNAAKAGQAQSRQPAAPAIGTIEDGHRFNGGDPSQQSNWEVVKN